MGMNIERPRADRHQQDSSIENKHLFLRVKPNDHEF